MASPKITSVCKICNEQFDPSLSGRKSTCSLKCRIAARGPLSFECRECGKQYLRPRWQVSQRSGAYFCSRECSFKHGKPFEKKFWDKIEKTESCWLWHGTRSDNGYGKVRYRDRQDLSHRVSYIIHKGEIPVGMVVRHKCDNPPCCNPDHLELGTVADNTCDKMMKQRQAQGERQGHAKFTTETVNEAKRLRSEGWTYLELERHFSISRQTISKAIRGETWKHVS